MPHKEEQNNFSFLGAIARTVALPWNGTAGPSEQMLRGKRWRLAFIDRQLLGLRADLQALLVAWPLLMLPCFMLGIASFFSLNIAVPFGLSLILLFFLGLCIIAWWQMAEFLRLILIALCCFLAGFSWMQSRSILDAAPVLNEPQFGKIAQGEVLALSHKPDKVQLVLRLTNLEGIQAESLPKKLRLSVPLEEDLPPQGARIEAKISVFPPAAPVIPSGYDPQLRAFFDQIGGYGLVQSPIKVLDKGKVPLLDGYRASLQDKLTMYYPDRAGQVMAALLIGMPQGINETTLEALRLSGLAHLLAISGLHVGMVAFILFLSLRYFLMIFGRRFLGAANKKLAALFTAVLLLFYVLLAGASLPTQRAYIMLLVVLLGVAFDRQVFSARLVAVAAFIILLFEPHALMTPSFQMSFSAVAMLIALGNMGGLFKTQERMRDQPLKNVLLWLMRSAMTSASATAGTAMITLYTFQRVSLLGIIANALAVPVTGFLILPLGLLGIVVEPFGLERLFWEPVHLATEVVISWAELIARIPFGVVYQPQFSALWVLLFSFSLWIALIAKGRIRFVALLVMPCVLYAACLSPAPDMIIHGTRGDIALVQNKELYLQSGKDEGYIPSRWMQAMGYKEIRPWEETGGLICDPEGCIWRYKQAIIAFPQTRAAASKDCQRADIVISREFDIRSCKAQVLDRMLLKQEGAMVMRITEQGFDFTTDKDMRGEKPWARYGN